ncbi:hypothetical protein CRG98_040167 [Punica granatum]|uniref:AB hydrolase-1 domain-containing protein n=1 Tax=Punica granatum TaxID=22663 RepID=A0A2I0I5X4_PUNGR|nr:hypothetical protein CRG98_040167 [Punica granatum]
MVKCFSFIAAIDWLFRRSFSRAGLRAGKTDLGDGTVMHCWAPKKPDPARPDLVLIHGVGSNAIWQWNDFLHLFVSRYNVYVPDLVFFGDSYTTRPDRSEEFQARCVAALMDVLGVSRMSVAGLSYGGFVAYSLGVQFPERVERLALLGSGVSMEEKDMAEGLFKVGSVEEAVDLLFPTSQEKVKDMMKLAFHKPPKAMPSCFVQDFIDEIFSENIKERTELVHALHKNRTLSNLPKITQPTLIIWGEYDQIFPIQLAHRLKRYHQPNYFQVLIHVTYSRPFGF